MSKKINIVNKIYEFDNKKKQLKILLALAVVLGFIILFRYEVAYNYALKSIPIETTYHNGSIVVSQDLNKVKDVLTIQYRSTLFKTFNNICILLSGILIFIVLKINKMCKCKNCKKIIPLKYILKMDFFECPYCNNIEI